MAGAYLEIFPQDTYVFTANVLLNAAAVELYQSTVWFTAQADPTGVDGANSAMFINLCSTTGNIAFSNNGTLVNSIVSVTLTSALTATLPFVNSAFWSLVAKTSTNAVYTLDRGKLAITRRVGVSYF